MKNIPVKIISKYPTIPFIGTNRKYIIKTVSNMENSKWTYPDKVSLFDKPL
ncbi:MAG: hypothetical protein AABX28_03550 [Nanoarchaeota archaeon]